MLEYIKLILLLSKFQINCVLSQETFTSEPLILTPLLNAGNITMAKNYSRVYLENFPDVISHSGFLAVNESSNSNLFFWFFPAANGNLSAPVLLWLQGGPGTSSMYGLLAEHGPFTLETDLSLKARKHSWSSQCNVLYMDNPVGTGYSGTDEGGYSTNQTQVGDNLYNALLQFFTLFSELQANEFYVTGQSYAGKYASALGYTIHSKNPTASLKINLKGFALGNPWIDPVSMMNYSKFLRITGLMDAIEEEYFKQKEQEIVEATHEERWSDAYDLLDSMFGGNNSLFKNYTGYDFYFNFLHDANYITPSNSEIRAFLSNSSVRNALHAGSSYSTYRVNNVEVQKYLKDDYMQSVKPWFEVLLEHYKVLVYNGQLDILIAHVLNEALLDSGADAFRKVPRSKWYVGEDLAGYLKNYKNLTLVMIRNAGHIVPYDQPAWAQEMIYRFVGNLL